MTAPAKAISSLREAHNQNVEFTEYITKGLVDFVDFGCSSGGSMVEMSKLFPAARGLGVDIDEAKIAQAKSTGHQAMVADARYLRARSGNVRFCILSHFLEHLPSLNDATMSLLSATEISTDFVFVRQPNFDADGYLFNLGYKTYWSDWHGHPNRMTALEMHRVFEYLLRRGSLESYEIYAHGRIKNSSDPAVHPLASPENQQIYDAEKHPPKPLRRLPFLQPVYTEIHAIGSKSSETEFTDIYATRYPDAVRLYSSHP